MQREFDSVTLYCDFHGFDLALIHLNMHYCSSITVHCTGSSWQMSGVKRG